jgi:hypothetical protein
MWNEKLASCGRVYESAVLTIVEPSGYPLSVRCKVEFDSVQQVITFTALPAIAQGWRGTASLLLHRHNEVLEDFHEMLVKGELSNEHGTSIFTPEEFLTGTGRKDTDRMPHAGAPLHLLQFMIMGRRKARAYLARRKNPWPAIKFDLLVRAAREVGN